MILLQPSQNALGVAYLFMSVGDSAGEQLIIQRDIYYYNPVHKAILSLSLSLSDDGYTSPIFVHQCLNIKFYKHPQQLILRSIAIC